MADQDGALEGGIGYLHSALLCDAQLTACA
jgi:hypothetical protein